MTAAVPATLAVVDTDAYSELFIKRPTPLRRDLADRLVGSVVAIATQTRAELLVLPRLAQWGARRRGELDAQLAATPVVPVTDDVVEVIVTLKVDCERLGHPLHQKEHTADRWVAATAIALDRPLLAVDMARIRSFGPSNQRLQAHTTEVDCEFGTIDTGESRLLHLSTFGSDDRASERKSSQSIQLDQQQAAELVAIIGRAFPALRIP